MLPNPGFDSDSFDGGAFDTSLPAEANANNDGVTNNRVSEEWYTCDRCGKWFPRSKMVNQNGLNVCKGTDTTGCYDKRGSAALRNDLQLPYEERPEPLPFEDVDL